jgi:hypothetical protein
LLSGGWNPTVNLIAHLTGKPQWRYASALVPVLPPGMCVVGAASGTFGLGACLAEGQEAGAAALKADPPLDRPLPPFRRSWHVAEPAGGRQPQQGLVDFRTDAMCPT